MMFHIVFFLVAFQSSFLLRAPQSLVACEEEAPLNSSSSSEILRPQVTLRIISNSRSADVSPNLLRHKANLAQQQHHQEQITLLFPDDPLRVSVLIEAKAAAGSASGSKSKKNSAILGNVSIVIEKNGSNFIDRTIRYLDMPLESGKSINFTTFIPLSETYIGSQPYEIAAKLEDWDISSNSELFTVRKSGTFLEILENRTKIILSIAILFVMIGGSIHISQKALDYFGIVNKRKVRAAPPNKKVLNHSTEHLDSYYRHNTRQQ